MNLSEEQREQIKDELNDRTAIGATGERLKFRMSDAPFESKTVAVASEEDRARMEAEKAEAARIAAQIEAQHADKPKTQFEVWGARILVRPLKTPDQRNGVLIAESARYLTAEGEVLAIGEGALLPNGEVKPLRSKVGDTVKYTPYTGSAFQLDGLDVLVLSERDVLGRVYRAS